MSTAFSFSNGQASQPVHFANRHPMDSFHSDERGPVKSSYYNPFEVKHRRRTTKSQFVILERSFLDNGKPSAAVRKALAEQLDMTPRGVQVWFQNRRAKLKIQKLQNTDCLNGECEITRAQFIEAPEHGLLHLPEYSHDAVALSSLDSIDLSPGDQSSSLANSEASGSSRQYPSEPNLHSPRWALSASDADRGCESFIGRNDIRGWPISGYTLVDRRCSLGGPVDRSEVEQVAGLSSEPTAFDAGYHPFYREPLASLDRQESFPSGALNPMLGRAQATNSSLQGWNTQGESQWANGSEWSYTGSSVMPPLTAHEVTPQPVQYPTEFDINRRASCPADFIASFFQMGVSRPDGLPSMDVSMAPPLLDPPARDYPGSGMIDGTGTASTPALRISREQASVRRPSVCNLNLTTIKEDDDHSFALPARSTEDVANQRTYLDVPLSMRRRASTPALSHALAQYTDHPPKRSIPGVTSNEVHSHSEELDLCCQSGEPNKVDQLLREIMLNNPDPAVPANPALVSLSSQIRGTIENQNSMLREMEMLRAAISGPQEVRQTPPFYSSLSGYDGTQHSGLAFSGHRRASMPTLGVQPAFTETLPRGDDMRKRHEGRQKFGAINRVASPVSLASLHETRSCSPSQGMPRIPEHLHESPDATSPAAYIKRHTSSSRGSPEFYEPMQQKPLREVRDLRGQIEPSTPPVRVPTSPLARRPTPNAWTSEAIEFQL